MRKRKHRIACISPCSRNFQYSGNTEGSVSKRPKWHCCHPREQQLIAVNGNKCTVSRSKSPSNITASNLQRPSGALIISSCRVLADLVDSAQEVHPGGTGEVREGPWGTDLRLLRGGLGPPSPRLHSCHPLPSWYIVLLVLPSHPRG